MFWQQKNHFLTKKIENYFAARTPENKGIIDYLLTTPQPSASSILINDNDYLRTANNAEVIDKQTQYLKGHQQEILMSGVFLSGDSLHLQISKAFAAFVGMEDVYLAQSGYAANCTLLQAISEPNMPVYIDQRTHPSFYDGIKFVHAKLISFIHNDVNDLENKIKHHGPGIILVDSVYSAVGSICPIKEICLLKNQYGCVLVVDESHSLGLYGVKGQGLVGALNLTNEVDFITASLSKAFSTRAGIIAGPAKAILFMREYAFPAIFSSAVLNYDIVRIQAMLKVIKESDEKREQLMFNANFLRTELTAMGYEIVQTSAPSPIICLVCGPEATTKKLQALLLENDIFGAVFCAPATSKNASLIRLTLHSDLKLAQLNHIVDILTLVRQQHTQEDFPCLFKTFSCTNTISLNL